MAIISEFYKRLRDLCEERNMTVNELVQILNLSSGSPTAWKNGAEPRNKTLSNIADYFGVSTDYLLGKSTEKTPAESDKRCSDCNDNNNRNTIRIAGRDGSYREETLSDKEYAALVAFLDLLPDAPEGL